MAAFPRVWPAPGLVFNAVPGSVALTQLDIHVSQAVNGFGGGSYSPVTPIVIGGAGLQVTGPFEGGFRTLITSLSSVSFGGGSLEQFGAAAFTASALVVLDIPAANVGNTIDVSLVMDIQSTTSNHSLKLVSIEDFGGANVTANIDGARHNTTTLTDRRQLALQGMMTVAVAGTVRVQLEVLASGPNTVLNFGTGCLIARLTP